MEPTSSFMLTKKDGEFLRILASLSVVTAHCIHYWVELFYQGRDFRSLSYFATIFDQATRFTVPLFFFLSGFGLTLQFQDKPIDLKRYYRFRLPKVLAPFLLWSAITSFRHLEYFESLPWSQDLVGTLKIFFKFLFLDGFDYQYYFLIIIFQFYCLYPFLYKLGKSKLFLGLFLLLHLSLMSPMEAYLQIWGLELPKWHPNIIIFHWFYCFIGIYAAWNKDFLIGILTKWKSFQFIGFWVLTLGILNFEFLMNINGEKYLADTDHFNRWSVLLYCLATLLFFMKHKNFITQKIYTHPRFQFLFTHIAPYTFFVYLAHTHVLRVVDYLLWEVSIFDFINRILLVLIGSYFLAWFIHWLLEDFPRLRFYFGLPEKNILSWNEIPGYYRLKIRRIKGKP